MPSRFDQLSSRSQLERIEDAIVEALMFDQETSSFCPWYRVSGPTVWPDRPLPFGRVVVTFSEGKFVLTMEEEIRVTAQIGVAYEELRDILVPGEKSIHSLQNAVLRVLREDRNSHLGAGNGNNSVVEKLDKFIGTDYYQILFGGEEEEEPSRGYEAMNIGVEYTYRVNSARMPA
jgi:hypothetical protein